MPRYNRKLVLTCFLSVALIYGGLIQNSYLYLGIVIMASLYILRDKNSNNAFALLLFLMPYSYIMKLNPESTSLYTIIVIIFSIYLLFENRCKVSAFLFLGHTAFFIYTILNDFTVSVSAIKIIFNTLILYLFIDRYDSDYRRTYLVSYILGLISSSFITVLMIDNTKFQEYFGGYDYIWVLGRPMLRFPGTFGDPNYLTIALIMGLNLLLLEYSQSKARSFNFLEKLSIIVAIVCIIVIGFFTFSKSFYFMLVVVFVLTFMMSSGIKNKIIYGIGLISIAFVIIYNPNGLLDFFFSRFQTQQFLTGRNDIWSEYIRAINQDFTTLIFGHGLSMEYVDLKAAHNMYLQALYLLGILGTILFFGIYIMIFFRTHRSSVELGKCYVLLELFVLYIFLNGVTAFEYPFYLMICYMCCSRSAANYELTG